MDVRFADLYIVPEWTQLSSLLQTQGPSMWNRTSIPSSYDSIVNSSASSFVASLYKEGKATFSFPELIPPNTKKKKWAPELGYFANDIYLNHEIKICASSSMVASPTSSKNACKQLPKIALQQQVPLSLNYPCSCSSHPAGLLLCQVSAESSRRKSCTE